MHGIAWLCRRQNVCDSDQWPVDHNVAVNMCRPNLLSCASVRYVYRKVGMSTLTPYCVRHSRVEKYILSPLKCTKCQKFGYHFSKCRSHTAICFRCSVPPSPTTWSTRYVYTMQQLREPSKPKICRLWGRSPIILQRMPKIQRRARNHFTQIYCEGLCFGVLLVVLTH